ncbi:hypothetical protein MSSAC_2135 [Methanosarcina siciliae C2J]|uniref:Uncharacterized protein n=2 Tax=Methanosarcina siciliae TaxID=38027 RepID=A0A0E3PNQ2_9EURY|nr:hypothetical protein MSSAC_2135 [Methanosarcina siciliae C2J]
MICNNMCINGKKFRDPSSQTVSQNDANIIETLLMLGEVYDIVYDHHGRAGKLNEYLTNAIYHILSTSPKKDYINEPVNPKEFVLSPELLYAGLIPQKKINSFDFSDYWTITNYFRRLDGLDEGDYFHLINPNIDLGNETDRIIVNIKTQQQAVKIAKHITWSWTEKSVDWKSYVSTFKILVNNNVEDRNNPNLYLKNDKMVIYFAETDHDNKTIMNSIKCGVEVFLANIPDAVPDNNLPLNGFYKRVGRQIGTGREIGQKEQKEAKSFTDQRVEEIKAYILNNQIARDRNEWIEGVYFYVTNFIP